MDFLKILTTAATVAGTGGSAPAAQLAGMGIQKLSSTLLGKADGTPEEIESAVSAATPEQLKEIKKIESRFNGIKETSEVIEAITLVAVFLTRKIKDGIGADDAVDLFNKLQNDPQFKSAMAKASDGIDQVSAELGDLDFEESITLGMLGLNFVKEVVTAMKE